MDQGYFMNALVESLQQLGLTAYEAKLLIALTQYGSGTASEIHTLSGVPRSAVYGVINKLESKGIIEVQKTKPMKYRILAPDMIIEKLKLEYEKAVLFSLEQLEGLYNTHNNEKEDNSVWNINGIKNVNDKIVQMLQPARKEIMFASSYPSLSKIIQVYPVMESIKHILKEKIEAGVKVKITGQDFDHLMDIAREYPGAIVRRYNTSYHSLNGGMLAIDNRELLVITMYEDQTPAGLNATWYKGKEHIRIFEHSMQVEWDSSTPVQL
jgi:sugar-specific transcriptional regulator TrmB